MKSSSKSQFFIFTTLFLVLALIVIYPKETHNVYMFSLENYELLDQLKEETCELGFKSNGSQLDSRFTSLEQDAPIYCAQKSVSCSLDIRKLPGAPSNPVDLNYTHYSYSVGYSSQTMSFNSSFTC